MLRQSSILSKNNIFSTQREIGQIHLFAKTALCNGREELFLLALSASAIAAVAILDSRFASRFLIVRIPFTQRAPSTKATGDESEPGPWLRWISFPDVH